MTVVTDVGPDLISATPGPSMMPQAGTWEAAGGDVHPPTVLADLDGAQDPGFHG
jgi:hypothetical protein